MIWFLDSDDFNSVYFLPEILVNSVSNNWSAPIGLESFYSVYYVPETLVNPVPNNWSALL